MRDIFADFCCRAHLPVKGYGLGRDNVNSCPSDVLIQGWDRRKPTAFDVIVKSSLQSPSVKLVWQVGQQHMQLVWQVGQQHMQLVWQVGQQHMQLNPGSMLAKGAKCQELGWSCIPLAIETYGNWGKEGCLQSARPVPNPK